MIKFVQTVASGSRRKCSLEATCKSLGCSTPTVRENRAPKANLFKILAFNIHTIAKVETTVVRFD